jgi:hypothetical protein
MTGWEYRWFRFRSGRVTRHLEAHYHRLAGPVDLSRPYIYVALSYQPERTTSPLGGVFVHQQLMVDLLARCLPEGWSLYVKEHPVQFEARRAFRTQCVRSKDYYDDLASIPCVRLVPMSVGTCELIDNARATAVVTGTVGWEAVNRGRPTLIFGYPWYRGCEGIFHVQTEEACAEALKKIEAGYEVDYEKLRLFYRALEEVGSFAYVDERFEGKIVNISQQENIERVTEIVKRHWGLQSRAKLAR